MGERCDRPAEVLVGKVGDSIAAAGSSSEPHDDSITENVDNIGQEMGGQSQPNIPRRKEVLNSFLEQWPSAVKAIADNNYYSANLKEGVKKIEMDLRFIKKSLGSVDKWGENVMDMFEFLNRTIDDLIQQLQITSSSGIPGSSNDPHDDGIPKMLDDIGQGIGKIKTQLLPFIRMPEEAFICFFKQRLSSAVKAIAVSKDDSGKIKERIENDLRDIERSLGSVDKWDISMMDVFEFLDGKMDELIAQVRDKPSPAAGSSNEQQDNSINEKLNLIGREIGKMKMHSQSLIRLPTIPPAADKITDVITNWRKLESEDEIMDCQAMADALSTYNDLEPRLKLCFLSLSMFPQEKYIRKRSLIYWWIGEDFLGNEKVEQVGEECFKKLCESGLIEPISDKQSRSPHSCRLHPWIRWMAIRIAKETMFLDFDSDGKPSSGPSECLRRACVATTKVRRAEKVSLKQDDASEFRSLFNIDVHCLECDVEEFKKLSNMVALQLGRWIDLPKAGPIDLRKYHIEVVNPTFLEHLGLLKRLRYLGLQGISRIEKLPESIAGLSELRVLDLRACHNLEKLPAGIASLKKLTHLDVSECYLLEYMPEGLGSLSKLQFLDGFVMISSDSKNKDACKFIELTKLGNLQKLNISISLSMEAMTAVEELKQLERITSLQTLTITWGGGDALPAGDPKETASLPGGSSPVRRFTCIWRKFCVDSFLGKTGRTISRKRTTRTSKRTPSPFERYSLLLPPKLTKLDLQCFPEHDAPVLQQKEKSLEKLYFRGGKLKSLSGIQGDEVLSQVKTLRLRFLKNLSIEMQELREMFPSLEYAEIHECPSMPFQNFKKSGQDKASTSNGSSVLESSVVDQ